MSQLTLALAAGGVLVIAVGAFVAYRKFFAAPPPPKPAVTARPVAPARKVEPPVPGPAAPGKPAAPVSADASVKSEAAPAAQTPKPADDSPTPAAQTPVPAAPAVAQVEPPPQAPPPEAKPSLQFRAFVDRLKIGGVRVGPPARVFIGGVTYQQGDVIEQDLGVVFVGVDPATGALLFKDGSGFVLRRQL